MPGAGVGVTRAHVQLLITVAIWGGYFVVAKKAVGEVSPVALALARYLVAGLLLLALALVRGPLPRPSRRDLAILALMGALVVVGFNLLSLWALQLATASDGALIMPTAPMLFTLPLAAWLFGERAGRWQVGGLALLVAGELLVFREPLLVESVGGERLAGIGLFFSTALLWALYTVCPPYLSPAIGPLHANLYSIGLGVLFLLPIAALPTAGAVADGFSPGVWAAIAYLGALQTVVGLIWWMEGVRAIGPSRAAVINTLVPIFALTFAAIFLDEVPGPERIAGAALVIGGVAMAAGVLGRAERATGRAALP